MSNSKFYSEGTFKNELLGKDQYHATTDSYNSANTKIYLNDFFLIDAVSFSYNISYSKKPIYAYNSEQFVKVAPGSILVQGSLAVVFTESNYFEVIRQAMYRAYHKNVANNNFFNANTNTPTAELTSKILEQRTTGFLDTSSIPNSGVANLNFYEDDIYGMPIASETIKVFPESMNVYSKNINSPYYIQTGIPNNEKDGGVNKLSPYIRRKTIYDYLASEEYGNSEFENLCEALEDQIWGLGYGMRNTEGNNSEADGWAEWDYGASRIRNEMEMDYALIKTSDQFVRSIMSGAKNNINFYIVYGDYNNPPAEHTVECINDVHFVDRNIGINADGQAVLAIYNFFGRIINENAISKLRSLIEPVTK